jgi:Flp pilus assembly pilin Flp
VTARLALSTRPRLLRRLARQQSGSAVTEFGLIAPVFLMLLMGIYDLTHMVYARSVLDGAVERAARDASLETANTEAADQMVEDSIRPVLPDVVLTTERKSYYDFADIKRPEQWTDYKGKDALGDLIQYAGLNNGRCDYGEPYIDENRSGSWDPDIGVGGNGGAGDVVMYTVTATYFPLFKIPFMPEAWNTRSMTATAIKKNQPFANQTEYSSQAGTCD